MNKNDVAVIFLNYQAWQETLMAVEQCHKILGVDYQNIIVIDNASLNDSAKQLNNASNNKFIFIQADKNGGYASGNNIGLRYAHGKGYKYALILNSDIELNDVYLIDKFKEVFDKDANVAVVNPDVCDKNGYLYNRDSEKPTFWDYTFGMFLYKKKGRRIKNLGGYAYVYRPQGCCMMLDINKLLDINFLDENTFLYEEEPILAERLAVKNYKCACCLNTIVIHNHSTTVKRNFTKKKINKIKNDSFSYYLKEYRKYSLIKIKICCLFNYLKLILLDM